MGNPNVHDHVNLPILVAGGAAGGVKGGASHQVRGADAAGEPAPDAARARRRAPRRVRRQQGQGRRAARAYERAASIADDVPRHDDRPPRCCCRRLALRAAVVDSPLADAAEKTESRDGSVRCLKQRVDVNAPQADGMTALHWAAYHDDSEMAELLRRRRRQREGGEPLRRDAAVARLHQRQRARWSSCCSKAGADPNAAPARRRDAA